MRKADRVLLSLPRLGQAAANIRPPSQRRREHRIELSTIPTNAPPTGQNPFGAQGPFFLVMAAIIARTEADRVSPCASVWDRQSASFSQNRPADRRRLLRPTSRQRRPAC